MWSGHAHFGTSTPWIESSLSSHLSWVTYNLVGLTGLTSLNCKMRKLFPKALVRMKFTEITDTKCLVSYLIKKGSCMCRRWLGQQVYSSQARKAAGENGSKLSKGNVCLGDA